MDHRLEAFLGKVESGEATSACVYELIDTYYQCVIGKIDELTDNDYAPGEAPFPAEFLQPVENRQSGIGAALSCLLELGHNVDASDGAFNALMLAVGAGDAPMVHFLIAHGANADSWPGKGEKPLPGDGNYYLDDIDIQFMHESFANNVDMEYLKALHRTALVLVEDAHLRPYNGHSLKVDEEGKISLGPAKTLF